MKKLLLTIAIVTLTLLSAQAQQYRHTTSSEAINAYGKQVKLGNQFLLAGGISITTGLIMTLPGSSEDDRKAGYGLIIVGSLSCITSAIIKIDANKHMSVATNGNSVSLTIKF